MQKGKSSQVNKNEGGGKTVKDQKGKRQGKTTLHMRKPQTPGEVFRAPRRRIVRRRKIAPLVDSAKRKGGGEKKMTSRIKRGEISWDS